MKHISYFDSFLKDVVNIDQPRLNSLDTSIEAIKDLIRKSDYGTGIRFFAEQGSLAHKTIISPVNGKAFDADIIIVVSENPEWEPKKYILDLRRVFWGDGRYADKAAASDVCVTLSYANDKKIDILPLLEISGKDGYHITHHRHNEFIRSEPLDFTQWLVDKNKISGGNSFRKVTRLLKYLRDHKRTFTCPSVLLTTLIGDRITDNDKENIEFSDVPTSLKSILNRLDSYFYWHDEAPLVENPSLRGEDLADLWKEGQFKNFKSKISEYTKWVNDAYDEEDHNESLRKWRKVFGDKFAEGKDVSIKSEVFSVANDLHVVTLDNGAAHEDSIVDKVITLGIRILKGEFYSPPHLRPALWGAPAEAAMCQISATYHTHRGSQMVKEIADGEPLHATGFLKFSLNTFGLTFDRSMYHVQWRVTNTGMVAKLRGQMRGDFYVQDGHFSRWEGLAYRGVHFVEAFVIRTHDNRLAAKSAPFTVVVK